MQEVKTVPTLVGPTDGADQLTYVSLIDCVTVVSRRCRDTRSETKLACYGNSLWIGLIR